MLPSHSQCATCRFPDGSRSPRNAGSPSRPPLARDPACPDGTVPDRPRRDARTVRHRNRRRCRARCIALHAEPYAPQLPALWAASRSAAPMPRSGPDCERHGSGRRSGNRSRCLPPQRMSAAQASEFCPSLTMRKARSAPNRRVSVVVAMFDAGRDLPAIARATSPSGILRIEHHCFAPTPRRLQRGTQSCVARADNDDVRLRRRSGVRQYGARHVVPPIRCELQIVREQAAIHRSQRPSTTSETLRRSCHAGTCLSGHDTPPPLEGLSREADQGWGRGAYKHGPWQYAPLPPTLIRFAAQALKGRGRLFLTSRVVLRLRLRRQHRLRQRVKSSG